MTNWIGKKVARKPAKQSTPAPVPSKISVKVALDLDAAGDPYYANYAEIALGGSDAEIVFARTPAKLTPEQLAAAMSNKPFAVPANVRVVVPHSILTGLRDAIDMQIKQIAGMTNG